MNDEVQAEAEEIEEQEQVIQSDVTEESTDDTETGEVETDDSESEEEPKKSRNQNAKARLRRKLSESEERNAQIADALAKTNEKFTALESKLDSVINPPASRPDRVDFETEEAYEDSLYEWRQPSTPESVEPPSEPPPQRRIVSDEVHENWLDQIDLAKDKYKDFDEKLIAIPAVSMTDSMTAAIMESDSAGEIAYFLGDNISEAARISKLSIAKQVREIDKLGNKFKSTTSSAPAPIVPAKGKDAQPSDISKMSMKEYAAYMNNKEYGGS